ncbi:MAG TPA: hypothetical protein VFR24_01635 [Candidatus Angelobacter sp.]|nr:hypothetical protein [Candidatus Angelobacter sp.]
MNSRIAADLAAALQNVLDQTYQMQGMFSDDDHTIVNAITDAEEALNRYKKLNVGLRTKPQKHPHHS